MKQVLSAAKHLPRAVLMSFGVALAAFIVASVGSMVLSGGAYAFGPGTARLVFTSVFVLALVIFVTRALLRAKSDTRSGSTEQ